MNKICFFSISNRKKMMLIALTPPASWGSPFLAPSCIMGIFHWSRTSQLRDKAWCQRSQLSFGLVPSPARTPGLHAHTLFQLCTSLARAEKSAVGTTVETQCGVGDEIPREDWRILIMPIFISSRCQPSELIEYNWKTRFSHFLYY